jgi:hypothetical protein
MFPALMFPPSANGAARNAFLALARAIPTRLRQFHVDMIHRRVLMLAYRARVPLFRSREDSRQEHGKLQCRRRRRPCSLRQGGGQKKDRRLLVRPFPS